MRVYYENESKMKICLDPDDLTALGITVDDFDYGTDNARELVDQILVLSGAVTSKKECQRLFVDNMKKEGASCVLYFSCRPYEERQLCYRFDSPEEVIDSAYLLGQIKAKLYRYENSFYLVATAPSEKHRIILSEFAELLKNKSVLLEEHARLISDDFISDFSFQQQL